MKNKDMMRRLREYFMKQDSDDVAYLASSLTVDLLRFLNFDQLGEAEAKSLIDRTCITNNQVRDFMMGKASATGTMQLHKMNSQETTDDDDQS